MASNETGTTYRIDDGQSSADEEAVRRLNRFAYMLDEQFRVPGTNFRVGLDGVVGLIPGIGDTATALLASYALVEGYRLGVPNSLIARMAANIGLDWLVGSVPVAGDLFDFAFKANRRNVDLLIRHLESRKRA